MPPSEGRRKHIALKDFCSVHAPCLVMVMHGTTTHANIIVGTGLFSIYDVTSSQYLRSRKIYMSLTVDEIRFEHTPDSVVPTLWCLTLVLKVKIGRINKIVNGSNYFFQHFRLTSNLLGF